MHAAFRPFACLFALFVLVLTSLGSGTASAARLPVAEPRPQELGTQFDLPGPPDSGVFGNAVYPLPDGSLIVTDPTYSEGGIPSIGAVYVYDANHTLIHRLTGSQANDQVGYYGVKLLPNGNYLVLSPNWDDGGTVDAGAVTWCSLTTGCDGVVSAGNSLIGSAASQQLGGYTSGSLTILKNGNYIVSSTSWPNGAITQAGSVTWCSAATGCFGKATPENSLVGSHALDRVGLGIKELSDGDYVVQSIYWRNDSNISVGAVTWCSGTAGCKGTVSAGNSLVGSQFGDNVGGKITPLSNGNYVVASPSWANGAAKSAGAVTRCLSNGGCTGLVSPANSLVGTLANDQVGSNGVIALIYDSYVVISPKWSNGNQTSAGAITWCNNYTGCVDTILNNQSLIGAQSSDQIGIYGATALTNGNYVTVNTVVRGANTYQKATFCGSTGCNGTLDVNISLEYLIPPSNYGSSPMKATPLDDGSYVVSTTSWWNGSAVHAGAVTYCSGQVGCSGSVSASNSLVGSQTEDLVGEQVVALPGGKYIVNSGSWANGANRFAGAVTFCSGSNSCKGAVSAQNSLVGQHNSDSIGRHLLILANNNYVVSSGGWDNGSAVNVGHVTWCSGQTGCAGTVLANRSLIGDRASTFVGDDPPVALSNGNYVAKSYGWPNGSATGAGAATWCPGDTGCAGVLSTATSLVGTQANDHVSNIITPLANGNYLMIHNTWSNGSTASAGAVTLGAGNAPVPVGPVSAENSILGTVANGGNSLSAAYDAWNGQLVVGKPRENRVSFLRIPTTSMGGLWDDPKAWDYGVPGPNGDAVIAGGVVTVPFNSDAFAGSVTVQNQGKLSLDVAASLKLRGRLDIQGAFDGQAGELILTGPGEHGLSARDPFYISSLIIESGAILVEDPALTYYSTPNNLVNNGIIRRAQTVSGPGRLDFGLTRASVQVTVPSELTRIQVDRIDKPHPHLADGADTYVRDSGMYWSLSVTPADVSNYQVSLYLGQLASDETALCRFNGAGWDCFAGIVDGGYVRLDGVTQLAGDWTVALLQKRTATIQINGLRQFYNGAPREVWVGTTPYGLAVDLTYTGINGTIYGPTADAPINVGSYNVQASIRDAVYMGSAAATMTIDKAHQSIAFFALPQKTYGDADFTVTASASSGLPVRFSVGAQDACTLTGSTVHLTGAGSCTVTAEQPGDATYNPAQAVAQTFTILKASASIQLNELDQVYDGSPRPVQAQTVPAGLNYSLVYAGTNGSAYGPSANPPVNAGSYTVQAAIDSSNYTGSAQATLTVARASQAITFDAPVDKLVGDPDFTISASASSGLPVSFTTGSQDACTVTGSTIHLTRAGQCTILAEQAGSANYNAAKPVSRAFRIGTAIATVQLSNLIHVYDGSPKAAQAVTQPAGLPVRFTYTGVNGTIYGPSATPPTNAGSYTAQAAVDSSDYVGSASAALVIGKASAAIQLEDLNPAYNGSPKPVTVRTRPAGLSFSVTYQNEIYGPSSAPPSRPGAYTVLVQIVDANYQGESSGTLEIGNVTIFLPVLLKE